MTRKSDLLEQRINALVQKAKDDFRYGDYVKLQTLVPKLRRLGAARVADRAAEWCAAERQCDRTYNALDKLFGDFGD